MKATVWLVLALSAGIAGSASAQGRGNRDMRFAAMDRNGDGVITRAEWRGSDRAFRNQDWNGDGILSGDEVRPGAVRRGTAGDDAIVGTTGQEDFTPARFRALDRDRDRRLTREEYQGPPEFFSRLDRNQDGLLTLAEFTGEDAGGARFSNLDTNQDGRLTRDEWRGSEAVFEVLDTNRDGSLTREEAIGHDARARDAFGTADLDRDGAIARNEWRWNDAAFDRLDTNRDGRLSRAEFETSPAEDRSTRSAAYRAGYDRGRQEGVQAGREDKQLRGAWDLEGQRELETADSGWEPRLGNRAEYQAGYRAGFRRGYPEGFGPRR